MTANSASLDALLIHPQIWRGDGMHRSGGEPTGWPELDAVLPGQGWPVGALSELLVEGAGIGELSLLMPVWARLSQAGQRLAMVAPPYLPYAPALQMHHVRLPELLVIRPRGLPDTAWAAEQCLRSGAVAATTLWLDASEPQILRRLQLAAEQGRSLAWLFRPPEAARQASPAALRLKLSSQDDHLIVDILKCRGRAGARVALARPRTTSISHVVAQSSASFAATGCVG